MNRPYGWDYHLAAWVALLLGTTAIVLVHRYLLRVGDRPMRWSRHSVGAFTGAFAAAVLALTWPVADLAAHWSLTALVSQRLILMLAVAPMLLMGLPHALPDWCHRAA